MEEPWISFFFFSRGVRRGPGLLRCFVSNFCFFRKRKLFSLTTKSIYGVKLVANATLNHTRPFDEEACFQFVDQIFTLGDARWTMFTARSNIRVNSPDSNIVGSTGAVMQ